MLNYIWGFMIISGVLISIFTGNLENVTYEALESSKKAISLCITLLGVMSMWSGILKIADKAGLLSSLSKKLEPLLVFLFPKIPRNSEAFRQISTNFIANIFGISYAATPAGLKAVQELQKYSNKKDTASDEICMFMIVNMSSLQLVTINTIAYRSEFGSLNPTEIIGAGIFATVISSVVGIIFAKFMATNVNVIGRSNRGDVAKRLERANRGKIKNK